jgi:hypothetical protein
VRLWKGLHLCTAPDEPAYEAVSRMSTCCPFWQSVRREIYELAGGGRDLQHAGTGSDRSPSGEYSIVRSPFSELAVRLERRLWKGLYCAAIQTFQILKRRDLHYAGCRTFDISGPHVDIEILRHQAEYCSLFSPYGELFHVEHHNFDDSMMPIHGTWHALLSIGRHRPFRLQVR